jgi:(p)ppGpp synthase/HD superfamily hydrolase
MARTDFIQRSPLTRDALAFAARRHAGQTREIEGLPFVTHPIEVACLLHESGYPDEVVAAGVLHDVIEDTTAERPDVEARFGAEVGALVAAVSEDPTIDDDAERKAALRRQVADAGPSAAAIFAADKVSKAREMRLRRAAGRFGEHDDAKVDHYRESVDMLEAIIPGHDLLALLRTQLEGLGAHPAHH